MSERQLLPMVHFDDAGELPAAQAAAKRLAEDISTAVVAPFEAEKQIVNRDHFGAQARVWGPREDHGRPLEISIDGRKA